MSAAVVSRDTVIIIHKVTNVPKADVIGHADPYLMLLCPPNINFRTRTHKGCKDADFAETFNLRNAGSATSLRIVLMDEDTVSDDELGELTLSLFEPVSNAKVPFRLGTAAGASTTPCLLYYTLIVPDPAAWSHLPVQCTATTVPCQAQALPVVSTMQQMQLLNPYTSLVPVLGVVVDAAPQDLNAVLARYEVPFGLLRKMELLRTMSVIEVIVDDSGSMSMATDMVHPVSGGKMTRWDEVFARLCQMLDVMVYFIVGTLEVRFLNRAQHFHFVRNAESQSCPQFLQEIVATLSQAWLKQPSGGTPALQRIEESFSRYSPGQAVLRMFFGDGVPDGGNNSIKKIVSILVNRPNPASSPFTFFSCTNDDSATEWMKECEEAALFTSEYDDFEDERAEILLDQGSVFPFSRGLYLVCCIVGSMCPMDLDALDECVPLCRGTLEEILGYQLPREWYLKYFSAYLDAQRARPGDTPQVRKAKEYISVWADLKDQFFHVSNASEIPAVVKFRQEILALAKQHNH